MQLTLLAKIFENHSKPENQMLQGCPNNDLGIRLRGVTIFFILSVQLSHTVE